MPSLTSCYFCGDAVGASLDEYDLPEDASPDDQVTVTLCAGCKGKLTELLEEIDPARTPANAATGDSQSVGSAVDADPDVAVEPAIEEDPELDPVAGEQEPIFADDSDAVLDEGLPVDTEETERPFGEDDAATADVDDSADSTVSGDADRSETGDVDTDSASSETRTSGADASNHDPSAVESSIEGSADDVDSHNGRNEADSGGSDDAPTGPEVSDDAPTGPEGGSDDADGDAPPVEVDAGGSGAASNGATGASGSSTGDGPLSDVSPRTYNRVVRLLQNREFPVDRADFEALATSAYELDHGECSAALDGAIEKGLLEERDGQLRRPE